MLIHLGQWIGAGETKSAIQKASNFRFPLRRRGDVLWFDVGRLWASSFIAHARGKLE